MGSPESEWSRGAYTEDETATTLTRAFMIQQTESTCAEWEALGLPAPGVVADYGADCMEPSCPVGNVSLIRAMAFANVRSEFDGYAPCYELIACTGTLEGHDLVCEDAAVTAATVYDCEGYRLPTEAELEYATRAGTRTPFYSGDMIPQEGLATCGADPNLEAIAWYCHTAGGVTHPVGQLVANQWGLFDVTGNALEWTSDSGVGNPGEAPWTDPLGTLDMTVSQVIKGGNAWSANAIVRSGARFTLMPNESGPSSGFRLVRSLLD